MSTYALVNQSTGMVENMVVWDGGDEWAAPDGFEAIANESASVGWSYAEGIFTAPAAEAVAPLTAAEILANNTATYSQLYSQASQAMTPLLVSLQLGDATEDETVIAKQWQEYYRGLTQVDLSVPEPEWPVKP